MTTKRAFIIPVFLFFLAHYFTLPVIVGLAPHFMSTKVIVGANLVYLFVLSPFFMAWFIAWRYVKAAGDFPNRGIATLGA
jgi:uncharacterized membrane protein (DUF485 family)